MEKEESKGDGAGAVTELANLLLALVLLGGKEPNSTPLIMRLMKSSSKCNVCNDSISEDYYRCLECDNFHTCSICFYGKKEKDKHKSSHIVYYVEDGISEEESKGLKDLKALKKSLKGQKQENLTCDVCKGDVNGLFYKCADCVDYDVCSKCYKKHRLGEGHNGHLAILKTKSLTQLYDTSNIKISTKIGGGAFGEVYKGTIKGKTKDVAVKMMTLNAYNQNEWDLKSKLYGREIKILASFRYPYIVKYYGRFVQKVNDSLVLGSVMEFVSGGTLQSALKNGKNTSLRRRFQWALEIIKGLRFLHSRNICHRDIKPDNILITSNQSAKIGDFGLAKESEHTSLHTGLGHRDYAPPEIHAKVLSQKSDMFSFGLVLYEIFSNGEFQREHTPDNFGGVIFSDRCLFEDIVGNCTNISHKDRPSSEQIALKFEAFDKLFWEKVGDQLAYIRLPTDEKNEKFLEIYNQYYKMDGGNKIRVQPLVQAKEVPQEMLYALLGLLNKFNEGDDTTDHI